jgi:hypothetical protein
VFIRARYSDGQPFRLPYPHLRWTKWVEVPDDYDKDVYEKFAEEKAPHGFHFVAFEESKEVPIYVDYVPLKAEEEATYD